MAIVVGVGPGNEKYLTVEALDIIETSESILSFGRVGETLCGLNDRIVRVDRVDELLEKVKEDTVILASGDPCFYGVVDYLARNGVELSRVVTGMSSLQYLMAKLKRCYQDIETVSFHGREFDGSIFQAGKEYFVLTDSINSPDKISKELYNCGYRGYIVVGENLSYEDERIEYMEIGDSFAGGELSVMVIKIEMD